MALLFAVALVLAFLNPSRRAEAAPNAGEAAQKGLLDYVWRGNASQATGSVSPANQTVITWRAEDNPHVISDTYTIPTGTKVVMEPGVVVQFSSDSRLQVDGELVGQGTATGRIQLQKAGGNPSSIYVTGTLNLANTDVGVMIAPASGSATVIFADCAFKGYGSIYSYLGYTYSTPAYVQLDRCTFDGRSDLLMIYSALTVDHATLVLRDVSFTGGSYARIYYSYVYLDRVSSDGAQGSGLAFNLDGPLFLDNITVTNASSYGLQLGQGYRAANYFLGSNVKLQGNVYPINLEGAGLLPGSTVPSQGNVNNAIRASVGGAGTVWAKFAVPYHVFGLPSAYLDGTTIAPGVTIKVAPQTTISAAGSGIRGTFEQPITFERLDPTQGWFAIGFQDLGSIVEHTVIEGAQTGVQTANNSHSFAYLNDVILRNNQMGTGGAVFVTGSQYINNGVGHGSTGGLTAMQGGLDGGPASPNSFVGNGKALNNTSRDVIPARYNWWNSPTGPTTSNNPGGTGDEAIGADTLPFLTSAPDYASDHPPVVRLHKPFHTYLPGSKVTLSWESSDDKAVVAHRVLFSKDGPGSFELLAELDGDQRAYEWTVPDIGFQVNGLNSYIRIVAVDSLGHERFDDAEIVIPSSDFTGSVTFTTDVAGKTFKTGELIPLEYTISDSLRYSPKDEFLLIAGEGLVGLRTFQSTDDARVAIRFSDNGNRERWFYSPSFKIRPDSRVGDQPPTVALTSPPAGSAFASGDSIPVTWTASDDEGVRSFNIEVSYDGGLGWTRVARDLPASTTSYNLKTAPGTGQADIRVRVTAYDRRFQASSAGADRSFSTSGVAQNARPLISLTSPGTESQFNLGSPVTITAEASDRDGTVARVDFYAGNILIGSSVSAPYSLVWNNTTSGTHALVAVATDDDGGTTKSAPVNVIINASAPAPGMTAGTQWAATYNGPSVRSDSEPYMALDSQGNIFLSGQSIGSGTLTDVATIKYDAQGRQLWAVRYVGQGNDVPRDVAVDAQGNAYVTAETWRRLSMDGGTEQDIVTLKYSPEGALLWARYYTGTQAISSQDTPGEMGVDAAGNVYVSGMTYRKTASGAYIGMSLLIKYDTNGNEVWVRTYDSAGENGSNASQLVIGPSGHVYVAGTVNNYLTATNTTDQDIFAAEYDAAGNLIWRSLFDTPNNPSDQDNISDMKVDPSGNVYLGGRHYPVSGQGSDFLTIKYNAGGTLAWRRTSDVSYAESVSEIALDSAGNIFVVGAAEFRQNGGLPNDDAVTVKYDANGNHLWTHTYTGMWNGNYTEDGAGSVLVDGAGNAYVGIDTRDEAGSYVLGLLKYTPDGTESLRTFRGPNAGGTDTLYDMAFDGAGDLYLAGSSYVIGQSSNLMVIKVAEGRGLTTPVITWDNPVDVTHGTALSSAQLNATSNVPGTFEYTPAAGTVVSTGINYLSVKFTPVDAGVYRTVTKGVTLVVNKAPVRITLGNLNQTYSGTARAVTVVTDPPDLNFSVSYSQNGVAVGSPVNVGVYDVKVTINNIYYEGTATGVLVISNKQVPSITWNNPADITYGTTLDATQLNAAASVQGTFSYTPASGAKLNAGNNQALAVTFTPADTANYSAVSRTVYINVLKATPTINWSNPSDITYGTALGSAQLNAAASNAGTLAYTPAAGTLLNAGANQSLSVNFTPTDRVNYNATTKAVSINVLKAEQTITFGTLPNRTFGDAPFALSAAASSGLPVSFQVVSGPATLNGNTLTLNGVGHVVVRATQAGDANRNAALMVERAFDVTSTGAGVTLSNLTHTYDGTAKSVATSTNPAGLSVKLSYSRNGLPVQSPTSAGSYNVTATIEEANYSGSATGIMVIERAAPLITWGDPADIFAGTPLGGAQLNATANVPGTFQYTPAADTLPGVGVHQLSANFTPTDAANYTTAMKSVRLTVNPAPSTGPGFELAEQNVSEASGYATINVTRSGDLSQPATVKYQTSDTTDVNFRCDPSTAGQAMGLASRKCDYHMAVGRLRFAPGEAWKRIVLSVVDDTYVEGPETFTITLSAPTGMSLGQNSSARVTITDDDFGGKSNPVDNTRFFVRQLYVDLLSREPDQGGWEGWTSRIDLCGQPGQAPPPCDRVTVGGDGFLRSSEFFDRQFFVLRLYRTGLGRILQYDEVGDLAYVSGFLSSADLELNKQDLVAEIMARAEFTTRYNNLTNAAFVDALLQTAAVTVPQADRVSWAAALDANSKTRAQVFREISERPEVSSKYLTEAQVVSAYYGFFTRNPDGAYLNYLQRLDSGEINLGDLANAFINAAEYRQRFGL